MGKILLSPDWDNRIKIEALLKMKCICIDTPLNEWYRIVKTKVRKE
mgnify:CR=1 FL=1